MFEEIQVQIRRQQFMDEAERSRLAHAASVSKPELYTQMKSFLRNATVLWNTRFQKNMTQIVEVCCAAVATPENECMECTASA